MKTKNNSSIAYAPQTRRIVKKDGFLHEMKVNHALYILLAPAVVYLIAFHVLPLFGILIAFKELDYSLGIMRSPWIGLKNFEFLFATPDAMKITRNTVLYNVAFLGIGQPLTIFVAVLLNEIASAGRKRIYQGIIFLPHFISWVIVGYIGYVFLSPQFGYLNKHVLALFGIGDISWYSSPQYWPFIIVLVQLWKNTGYGTIIYLAAITAIDPELYEAAVIDGASRFKQAMRITIPCLKPTIVINFIMGCGSIFSSDFGLYYFLTRNSPALYPVTQVIGMYTYRALRELGDLGMSSAAGLYQAAVGFVLVAISNQIIRKMDEGLSLY